MDMAYIFDALKTDDPKSHLFYFFKDYINYNKTHPPCQEILLPKLRFFHEPQVRIQRRLLSMLLSAGYAAPLIDVYILAPLSISSEAGFIPGLESEVSFN